MRSPVSAGAITIVRNAKLRRSSFWVDGPDGGWFAGMKIHFLEHLLGRNRCRRSVSNYSSAKVSRQFCGFSMWTLVSCGQLIRIKRTAKEYVTESILGSRGMHLQSIKMPGRKFGVIQTYANLG